MEVVDVAILVDELVGGVAVDAYVVLDGTLLVFGQVVVYAVGACQVVLLDDILPRLVAAAVGQVEIDEIVVFQPLVFFLRVREGFLARAAPCAPDV